MCFLGRYIRLVAVCAVLFCGTADVCGQADLLDDAIEEAICGMDFDDVSDGLSICGEMRVSAEMMTAFVRRHNPDFDHSIARRCGILSGDCRDGVVQVQRWHGDDGRRS